MTLSYTAMQNTLKEPIRWLPASISGGRAVALEALDVFSRGNPPLDSGNQSEIRDLILLCVWLQQKYGNLPLTLVGYSFGARVVWSSLPLLTFTRAICIAPPTKFMLFVKHGQTLSSIQSVRK